MTDLKPPTPPNPVRAVKGAGKGLSGILKGQPKAVWIAGVVALVGMAYLAYRRSQANAVADSTAAASPAGADPSAVGAVDQSAGSYYDGGPVYSTPDMSQGAWGGWSDPGVNSSDGGGGTDNAGRPETLIIIQPGPVPTPAPTIPHPHTTDSGTITGGGRHPHPGHHHHRPPPKPKGPRHGKPQPTTTHKPHHGRRHRHPAQPNTHNHM